MPNSQSYKSSLTTFGRHTPRTLRQQLLCQLALQYLGIKEAQGGDTVPAQPDDPMPSVSRFHGALLFVDISGFTALSLRLKVEELKNHINDYFTTMLNIVDKWDGDVIKFAGDALYVVWKTELSLIEIEEDESGMSAKPSRFYSKDFLDSKYGQKAIRSSLEKATACGLEISKTCCNHEVQLDPTPSEAPTSGGLISKILPKWARLPSTSKVNPEAEHVAYLNVHAGVSYGLMGGVDIGALDRWEYFLIGEPLHRVAEAEEEAAKGDIVICPEGHAMLHGIQHQTDQPVNVPLSVKLSTKKHNNSSIPSVPVELACGCTRTPKGFFKITKLSANSPQTKTAVKTKRARSKARIDESNAQSPHEATQNFRIYDECYQEIERLYSILQGILKTEVQTYFNRSDVMNRQQKLALNNSENSTHSTQASSTTPQTPKSRERWVLDIVSNDLRKQLFDWMQYTILEDIVKHVHDVMRDDYYYEPKPRSTAFKTYLENVVKYTSLNGSRNTILGSVIKLIPNSNTEDPDDDLDLPIANNRRRESIDTSPNRGIKHRNPSLTGNQFTTLVKRASSKYLVQDSVLNTEIRNVMVMFIKIVGLELELMVDNTVEQVPSSANSIHQAIMNFSRSSFRGSASGTPGGMRRGSNGNPLRVSILGANRAQQRSQTMGGVFDFIDRSANEIAADNLMLSRVQKCMEALCEIFADNGGQMRQFIVDDKGTVCIGTFGLKGSVGVDNAAAALETAKKIVIRLQIMDLTASIGITSGKAYCGLVGSPARHEYAVMGPSTNLSARLMCKAPPYGVICDIETKNRDRTHGFEPLSEVNAKGYAHPVMTFKPIFEDIVHHLRLNKDSHQLYAALSPNRLPVGSKKVNTRHSMDWYTGSLAKSHSMHFRGSFDIPGTPPAGGVDLSGKGSTRSRMSRNASQSAFFMKRRQSITDSNLMKDELLKLNTSKFKLHGREEELKEIFSFLFPVGSVGESLGRIIQDSASLSKKNSLRNCLIALSSNVSQTGSMLRATSGLIDSEQFAAVRMVVISGGEGTGKSALADSILQTIFLSSKSSPTLPLYTFKNRPSSLEMHIPFHGVKPIVQDMLAKIDNVMTAPRTPKKSPTFRETCVNRVSLTIKESIRNGLGVLFEMMPREMQQWKPLLASAQIIPHEEENEESLKFEGKDRVEKTIELIVTMISLFPVIASASMMLFIEEMQSLDSPSRTILYRVFRDCRHILILATHRANPTATTTLTEEPALNFNNTLSSYDLTDALPLNSSFSNLNLTLTSSPPPPTVLDPYLDSPTFKLIELQPLSLLATKDLILDSLPDYIKPRIEDVFIDKIVEASGGHPLYAYEMTRGMVAKMKEDNVDMNKLLAAIGVGVASNRIEEMICYRFDQLDGANQMVLKAAAVACSNGAPFTLEMLTAVLIGEANFDDWSGTDSGGEKDRHEELHGLFPTIQIPLRYEEISSDGAKEVLEDILQRGEFIQICRVDDDIDNLDKSLVEMSANRLNCQDALTPTTLLEFKIVLEQITIYNLLVDDQREYLHERVAHYYHGKANGLSIAAEHNLYLATLNEEAYHWQHGACYIRAMKAYYSLAMMYKDCQDQHLCNTSLQTAYSMFVALKLESNIPNYSLCSSKELKEAFQTSSIREEEGPKIIGDDGSRASDNTLSPTLWTLETLYILFNGEIEDLRIALQVHKALVLNEFLGFENPKYIMPVAEECIRMMLAVRKPHILATTSVSSSLLAMSTSNSRRNISDKTQSFRGSSRSKKAASIFYLSDFETFCPPVYFIYALSCGIIEAKHMPFDVIFHADAYVGKGKVALEELVKLIKVSPHPQVVPYWMAQTCCLQVMFQLGSHQISFTELDDLLPKIISLYSHTPPVLAEAESYLGLDLVGLTFAFTGQFFILRGDITKGRKHLAQAIESLKSMTQPTSAAFALPPIIASLQLIRDYDEAFRVLDDFDILFGVGNPFQPTVSSESVSSEKISLSRRVHRTASLSVMSLQSQSPSLGLRSSFIQKLRVWLMCDRNQNSQALDLTQRISAFSQLNSRLHQAVMKEILNPQALEGNFWSDYLLFCGLSLPAITAMIFCCHTVMSQGIKLFTSDTLKTSIEDYAKKSFAEHDLEKGLASIAAKLYYYTANIKISKIVHALGVDVKHLLVPAQFDEQLLRAMKGHKESGFPLSAAILGNLALQISISKEKRARIDYMQESIFSELVDIVKGAEENDENNDSLEHKKEANKVLQRH